MGLFDTLFGGTDTSGQEAQIAANAQTAELIRQQAERARSDVLGIFPAAQQARQQGIQGALDIFGQVIPQQAALFQQGQRGAQDVLQGGLSAFNNAILGLPQDLSFTGPLGQPSPAFDFNLDFAQQQLPQFLNANQLGLPATGGTTPLFTPSFTPSAAGGSLALPEIDPARPTPVSEEFPIGDLVTSLLNSPNLTPEQIGNTIIDEAAAEGLSVQELANRSSLTIGNIEEGLSFLGRTLPGASTPEVQSIGNIVENILGNQSLTPQQMGAAIINEANARNLSIEQLAENSVLTRSQIEEGIDFLGSGFQLRP